MCLCACEQRREEREEREERRRGADGCGVQGRGEGETHVVCEGEERRRRGGRGR